MAVTRSTISQQDREFVETWENIAAYQNAIVRIDVRGEEKPELITGPRNFMLTTEERILTQGKILDPKDDPFRNGAFRPVVVPDDVTIETNPNALSDEEILGIFASSDIAWSEWLAILDSPATLNRMVDLADEADGVTVKRLREVQLRLREVKPPTRLTAKNEQLQRFLDEPSPRTGGRSQDYRS